MDSIDTLDKHKKIIVAALEASGGNVSACCRNVGISRSTFYNYVQDDEKFALAVYETKEAEIDMVEDALKQKIQGGDTASIIFYLKTQGKKRGWREGNDVTVNGTNVQVIFE
jgi:transposase-like protein